jgi:hypothetical protein
MVSRIVPVKTDKIQLKAIKNNSNVNPVYGDI